MNNKVTRNQIFDAFVKLKQDGPRYDDCGICVNIDCLTGYKIADICRIVGRLSKNWKHFSGDENFPVPSTSAKWSSSSAAHFNVDNKWIGRYGRMRVQLLNHCIRQLKAMTDEQWVALRDK